MPKKDERIKTKTKNVCIIDGEYYYRYDLKNPATGGRIQKEAGPYKSEKEAETQGILIKAAILNGTYISKNKLTISEFADQWLIMYKASGVKSRTVKSRKSTVKAITKRIGGLYLQELTSIRYQEELNKLRDEKKKKKNQDSPEEEYKYSRDFIIAFHSVMKMMFNKALELEYIKKDITQFVSVPVDNTTVEQLESNEELPEYLEKEQLAKFLKESSKCDDLQMHRIYFVLAYTGMRIGELLALRPTDIDEVNKVISITKTLYVGGSVKDITLNTPKNKSSIRKIDVSKTVISILKEQIAWRNEYHMEYRKWYVNEHNFIFINTNALPGRALNPNIVRDHMKEILKKAELPASITPHSLRHTYTSLMSEAGVELEAIQKLLGHKKDNTTKEIYLHVTQAKKRAAVEKLDELLGGLL